MKQIITVLLLSFFFCNAPAQTLYFPPINNNLAWDTLSPNALGWCNDEIDSLYHFLAQENSKAFIVLKDGKIVLEKYFGSFTKDSVWYWASAGKTLTSLLIGQAQEEGYLNITDTSSQYLGVGWTNCPLAKENKITIRHQLTMTSGLDDGVPDNHCTLDTCLNYLADAGNRWAYHNAPYTLLEKVLVNATGQNINAYTQQKIKTQTGITGTWLTLDYDNVFFSKARSMAKWGLLMQNKAVWNGDTLLHDAAYLNQMTNSSQNLNLSYGYLWWLNGKSTYMLPTSQFIFNGSAVPDAPADMFAGLGKNGQIVCIAPSKGLVVVRMGNQPNSPLSEVPNIFCNQIWQKLNAVMCSTAISDENEIKEVLSVSPNPFSAKMQISHISPQAGFRLSDMFGQLIYEGKAIDAQDFSYLAKGVYLLQITEGDKKFELKVIKE